MTSSATPPPGPCKATDLRRRGRACAAATLIRRRKKGVRNKGLRSAGLSQAEKARFFYKVVNPRNTDYINSKDKLLKYVFALLFYYAFDVPKKYTRCYKLSPPKKDGYLSKRSGSYVSNRSAS